MNKRGQVSVFVIIGIILIILILLFLFLRNRVYIGPTTIENLEDQFPAIKEHIEECILQVAEPRIWQMARQGGYIETPEDTFRMYRADKISYLCWNIENKQECRTRILRIHDMQEELSKFIKNDLQNLCLNINSFNKAGIGLSQGELKVNTIIQDDVVVIEATLPIIIRRGDLVVQQSDFSQIIELPLGRLYQASRDIVNTESQTGLFDTVLYSITKTQVTNKPYIAQRIPVYPDKLYLIKLKDVPEENNEFVFQLFIQDEPR